MEIVVVKIILQIVFSHNYRIEPRFQIIYKFVLTWLNNFLGNNATLLGVRGFEIGTKFGAF